MSNSPSGRRGFGIQTPGPTPATAGVACQTTKFSGCPSERIEWLQEKVDDIDKKLTAYNQLLQILCREAAAARAAQPSSANSQSLDCGHGSWITRPQQRAVQVPYPQFPRRCRDDDEIARASTLPSWFGKNYENTPEGGVSVPPWSAVARTAQQPFSQVIRDLQSCTRPQTSRTGPGNPLFVAEEAELRSSCSGGGFSEDGIVLKGGRKGDGVFFRVSGSTQEKDAARRAKDGQEPGCSSEGLLAAHRPEKAPLDAALPELTLEAAPAKLPADHGHSSVQQPRSATSTGLKPNPKKWHPVSAEEAEVTTSGGMADSSWMELVYKLRSGTTLRAVAKALFWDLYHPSGRFRAKWDMLLLLLLAYTCLAAPYIICFGVEFKRASVLGLVETFVDSVFVVDIYINFRTAFEGIGAKIIWCRRRIAYRYLRGWFFIDVISVVPFDAIVTNQQLGFVKLFKATRMVKLVKMLRLLKMMKLLRLLKLPDIMRHLEFVMGRGLLQVAFFLSAAVVVTHLVACFFYYTAYMADLNDSTWVALAGLADAHNFELYVSALYWSMSTLTTVGYGDIYPGNANEKVVSMLGMMIGVTIFAYFMGSMAQMMSTLNSSQTRVRRKQQAIDDFLRKRGVPPMLCNRIRAFFSYILQRQVMEDESSMLSELSVPLRTEMILYLYRDALEKVPFFRGKDPQFIASVVTFLRLLYFSPCDVVIKQNDPGNVMYFLAEGLMEVRLYHSAKVSIDTKKLEQTQERIKWSDAPVAAFELLDVPARQLEKELASMRNSSAIGAITQDSGPDKRPKKRAPSRRRTGAQLAESLPRPDEDALEGVLHTSLSYLYAGDYFGEYSLLLGEPRTSTIVAADFSELYSLTRNDLEQVVATWPEMLREFDLLVEKLEMQGYRPSPPPCSSSPSLLALKVMQSTVGRTQEKLKKPTSSQPNAEELSSISLNLAPHSCSSPALAGMASADGWESTGDVRGGVGSASNCEAHDGRGRQLPGGRQLCKPRVSIREKGLLAEAQQLQEATSERAMTGLNRDTASRFICRRASQ